MSDIVKVNKLELASEIAHILTVKEWGNTRDGIMTEDGEALMYSMEAQFIFNDYYDEIETLIDKIKES